MMQPDLLVWPMSHQAGCVTYTAASHQAAIKMIRLLFGKAVMSSIFIYSLGHRSPIGESYFTLNETFILWYIYYYGTL